MSVVVGLQKCTQIGHEMPRAFVDMDGDDHRVLNRKKDLFSLFPSFLYSTSLHEVGNEMKLVIFHGHNNIHGPFQHLIFHAENGMTKSNVLSHQIVKLASSTRIHSFRVGKYFLALASYFEATLKELKSIMNLIVL